MAEELLAERELQGYPGVTAQLHIDRSYTPVKARVVITNPEGDTTVYANPDAYLHPFAFGYGLKPTIHIDTE